MAQILIQHLTYAYEGSYDDVFEDVSFSIDTDWKLGFIGRNGRGKTTFLKLLTGELDARGAISAPVLFDYFPTPVAEPAAPALDVAQDICPQAEQWELLRELKLLEVEAEALNRPFETLSNGERTKILLAAMFLGHNHFPLIDEPTNHLDLGARRAVKQYLKNKKGFILVSHDRAFLDGCVDHVLSINKQNIEVVRGNFSSWWQDKENRDEMEREQDRRLKKDIERLNAAARRTAEWSDKVEAGKYGNGPVDRGFIGAQSARMMKRAKATQNRALAAAQEKSGLLKNVESHETLKIHPLSYHSDRLVTMKEVCVRYGERSVCGPLDLSVGRGERIALRGRNGSGKTSLLRLICGEDVPHTGEVRRASGLILSYVPQDADYLRGTPGAYAAALGVDETLFKTILRKMDFSRTQLELDMAGGSSGMKKKVLLAGSLAQQAHLYVWDEPLNFIDVLSRIQIESLILEYGPSMIFVEHDEAFCDTVATRTVKF